MLRTKVILSQVTNLSDARYAAGMGVSLIGFSIDPENPNFVTPEDVNAIANWLSGVSLIGEVGKGNSDTSAYQVDYIQISGVDDIHSKDEPIVELNLNHDNQSEILSLVKQHARSVSFFIIKIKESEILNLQHILGDINAEASCYIASEFNENNIELVLDTNPDGIVLYGTYEEKPGLSNYDGIADVLELLDED